MDGQLDDNAEEKLAARVAFLETRLLQSEEEVAHERKSADAQLAAAKRKEEELKALQNSSSPIQKSRSSVEDVGQLQAELAALKEQMVSLQISISQAETLSQLVLRLENQVAAHRDDNPRLAVAVAELEEQNAAKISELIELKLSVCDLADKVERKKKILRSLATNAASTTRRVRQDNSAAANSAAKGSSSKLSKLSSKERMSIESPSMDGSRSSKLSNYSSGSGNSNSNSDQNPLSLMQNLTLSHLGGQGAQGLPSSVRRMDSGRHIAVRFERSPTIASVESLEY